MNQNCWSFKDCGMNTVEGSAKSGHSICPAAREKCLDGANDGLNAGRACWVVDGTLCTGAKPSSFMEKLSTCRGCDFHAYVRKEQGEEYVSTSELLKRLRTD